MCCSIPCLSHLAACRFAAAHSGNPHLAAAIVECVQQLKSSLGPGIHPDLCQLLVTSRPHANSLSLAPSVRPTTCSPCLLLDQQECPDVCLFLVSILD